MQPDYRKSAALIALFGLAPLIGATALVPSPSNTAVAAARAGVLASRPSHPKATQAPLPIQTAGAASVAPLPSADPQLVITSVSLSWPAGRAASPARSGGRVASPIATLGTTGRGLIELRWVLDGQRFAESEVHVRGRVVRVPLEKALPSGQHQLVVIARGPTGVEQSSEALAFRISGEPLQSQEVSKAPGGDGAPLGTGTTPRQTSQPSGFNPTIPIVVALAAVAAVECAAHRICGGHSKANNGPPPPVPAAFEGTVEDADGRPLTDATVELRQGQPAGATAELPLAPVREKARRRVLAQSSAGGDLLNHTTYVGQAQSDVNGRFRILRMLDPGQYYLVVTHFGTEIASSPAMVVGTANAEYLAENFVLKPLGIHSKRVLFADRPIYFAADRQRTISGGVTSFTSEQNADGLLSLGTCNISVARDPKHAIVPDSRLYRFVSRSDVSGHATLDAPNYLEDFDKDKRSSFFQRVDFEARRSKSHAVLVFIHGFANTFPSAAMAAGQLEYDLNFDGPTIVYSWPSAGDVIGGYLHDRDKADDTRFHLADFLSSLARYLDPSVQIDVIAHSMGNQALIGAMREVNPGAGGRPHILSQVVLAAPDYEAEQFREKELAARVRAVGSHLTMYASSTDQALIISQAVHKGARLGLITNGAPVIVPGVDSIDASDVDTSFLGHSYFKDSKSVVIDVDGVIREMLPQQRQYLEMVQLKKNRYWKFAPTQ